MPHIARTVELDPHTLSAPERDALVDALYAVHCEIFDGVDRAEFRRYVIESSADENRIQVSYGEAGDVAGYVAAHSFRRKLGGELVAINRAEAGLRRAYRGDGSPANFLISRLVRGRWDFAGPQYYLGCLVHPSSYTAFAHHAPVLWPARDVEIPPDLFDLMMRLADEFHLDAVDPARPLVRKVGWITRDTEGERRYWQNTDLPAPRFYLEQNPTYHLGHGLLTVVPLDHANLVGSVANWGAKKLKKALHRTVGALERTVLKARLDAPTAEDLLGTVEEVTGLDLDVVREHGPLGVRHPVPSRTVLFREGDRPDALYAVIEGSLFVLGNAPDGDEIVIDQIGPGSLVGEMGLMTGQPRTFTVRAATDAVLLKLGADEITKLFELEPRLADALWAQICGRVFSGELRRVPSLARLSRDAQEAWFARGTSQRLVENEGRALPDGATLVLAKGRVRAEGEGVLMTLTAPSLARLPAGAHVTALTEARVALLPAEPASA